MCYLLVGFMFCFAAVRRHPLAAVATVYVGSLALWAQNERVLRYFGGDGDLFALLKLVPYFMAGALIFQLRRRIS
jgi:hypothetical protein